MKEEQFEALVGKLEEIRIGIICVEEEAQGIKVDLSQKPAGTWGDDCFRRRLEEVASEMKEVLIKHREFEIIGVPIETLERWGSVISKNIQPPQIYRQLLVYSDGFRHTRGGGRGGGFKQKGEPHELHLQKARSPVSVGGFRYSFRHGKRGGQGVRMRGERGNRHRAPEAPGTGATGENRHRHCMLVARAVVRVPD